MALESMQPMIDKFVGKTEARSAARVGAEQAVAALLSALGAQQPQPRMPRPHRGQY